MDATNRSTVVGVFRDRTDAQHAMDDLWSAGFRDDQIGILATGQEDAAGDTSAAAVEHGSNRGKDAVAGIVIGGILGAAASFLLPGIGLVLAGGILAGVVGGAAVGAVAGGVAGILVGEGVPENEAHYYAGEVHAGRILVTVRSGDRGGEARDILRRDGAYDIEDRGAGSAEQEPAQTAAEGSAAPTIERTQ